MSNISRLFRHTQRFATLSRSNSTMVVLEHDNGKLNANSLAAITAAQKIGFPITAVVAGSNCGAVSKAAASIPGVSSVVVADDKSLENGVAEPLSALLVNLQQHKKFTHILASSSTFSRNVLPRVAAKLDVAPISDVIAIDAPDTFTRPIYAGNAIATVKSSDAVKIVTVRPTAFAKAAAEGGASSVETAPAVEAPAASAQFVKREVKASERPDLGTAKVVVSGGRALKSAENFKIIEELADKLGGAVGASRAAVDAGYAPNELQVGQTGRVVAPELYIAVGISGAIQHLAGMKDSKTIVAINKDPEAPIFQVADLGLVADLFTAVPEMTNAIKK